MRQLGWFSKNAYRNCRSQVLHKFVDKDHTPERSILIFSSPGTTILFLICQIFHVSTQTLLTKNHFLSPNAPSFLSCDLAHRPLVLFPFPYSWPEYFLYVPPATKQAPPNLRIQWPFQDPPELQTPHAFDAQGSATDCLPHHLHYLSGIHNVPNTCPMDE